MVTDQETVSKILSVLSHPIRRNILINLSEKSECSFTDLMNSLHVDTGKLSFHIRSLAAFLEQTPDGKYKLSTVGEHAVRLIRDVETWAVEAEAARKGSSLPLASFKKRAFAFLIDFLVTFAIFIPLPGILSFATTGDFLLSINVFLNGQIIIFYFFFLWIYATLLEGFVGQTLGKRVVGLRVVAVDGKKLQYDQVGVRTFGKAFLLLLPFDLIFGYRTKDARFIRYFDKFAGTTVVDLRPSS